MPDGAHIVNTCLKPTSKCCYAAVMAGDTETTPRKRGRGADPAQTKADLIDAAIASLVEDGYRGTTARSIAARAGCNQAAIYYHFNGIEPLLVEALHHSSAERLSRYQNALQPDDTLPQLVARLEALYREDRNSGHMALLTELVGGITATPELRAGIEAATETVVGVRRGPDPIGRRIPAVRVVVARNRSRRPRLFDHHRRRAPQQGRRKRRSVRPSLPARPARRHARSVPSGP